MLPEGAVLAAFDTRWQSGALKHIADAMWHEQPIVEVAGPPGCGKTTVCHRVAKHRGTRTFVAVLAVPPATTADLLHEVLVSFGVLHRTGDAPIASAESLRTAFERFLSGLAAVGARVIVVVDDSHRLPAAVRRDIDDLVRPPRNQSRHLQFVLVAGTAEPRPNRSIADRFETVSRSKDAVRVTVRFPEPPRHYQRVALLTAAAAIAIAAGTVRYRLHGHDNGATSARAAANIPNVAADNSPAGPGAAGRADVGDTPPGFVATTGRRDAAKGNWARDVVDRGAMLAKRPDVAALMALRSQVASEHHDRGELKAALDALDRDLDAARRLQLAIDHQLLTAAQNSSR